MCIKHKHNVVCILILNWYDAGMKAQPQPANTARTHILLIFAIITTVLAIPIAFIAYADSQWEGQAAIESNKLSQIVMLAAMTVPIALWIFCLLSRMAEEVHPK